jgi:hypothetical protein
METASINKVEQNFDTIIRYSPTHDAYLIGIRTKSPHGAYMSKGEGTYFSYWLDKCENASIRDQIAKGAWVEQERNAIYITYKMSNQ